MSSSEDRPEPVYLQRKYGKGGRSCIRPPKGDLRGVIKKRGTPLLQQVPLLCVLKPKPIT